MATSSTSSLFVGTTTETEHSVYKSNEHFTEDIHDFHVTLLLFKRIYNNYSNIKKGLKKNEVKFNLNSNQVLTLIQKRNRLKRWLIMGKQEIKDNLKSLEHDCHCQLVLKQDFSDRYLLKTKINTRRLSNQLRNYRWQISHNLKTYQNIIEWGERLLTKFKILYEVQLIKPTFQELRKRKDEWNTASLLTDYHDVDIMDEEDFDSDDEIIREDSEEEEDLNDDY